MVDKRKRMRVSADGSCPWRTWLREHFPHHVFTVILSLLVVTSCAHQRTYLGISQSDNKGPLYLQDQLKLTIKLENTSYELEVPIPVKCEIENVGQTNVFLYPSLSSDITLYLKHQDERKATPLSYRFLYTLIIRKEDIVRLQPGGTFLVQKEINRKLYFRYPDRKGKYELYAVYHNRLEHLENIQVWTGELRSNILAFQVR